MRRYLAPAALLLLAPIAVFVSVRGELDDFRKSNPLELKQVAVGAESAYGPATWRFERPVTSDRLHTSRWLANAPATGTWLVATISYRLDTAPASEHWCEVTFADDRGRRWEIETGTTIAGRPADCTGGEDHKPAVGSRYVFTVAALVPDDAAGSARPRVTIRSELPVALELIRS